MLSLLNMHLLRLYYVPGTLLGTGDIVVNEINMAPGFMEMVPRYFAIDMNVSALLAFRTGT